MSPSEWGYREGEGASKEGSVDLNSTSSVTWSSDVHTMYYIVDSITSDFLGVEGEIIAEESLASMAGSTYM